MVLRIPVLGTATTSAFGDRRGRGLRRSFGRGRRFRQRRLDVAFDDAPTRAGSRQGGEVEPPPAPPSAGRAG